MSETPDSGALSSAEKRSLLRRLLQERAARPRVAPLSFAQQRLWFLDQLVPGSPAYCESRALRVAGPVDRAAFQAALNEVVRRHEILRTTVAAVAGRPSQVIAPVLTVPLAIVDLIGLPFAEREGRAHQLADEHARQPFDLARGPLLRVLLLKLDEMDHVLVVSMHHIIADGWSIGVLVRELLTLYRAFAAGRPSPLAGLPMQYADYARWQQQWFQDEVLQRQLSYWKERLADLPVLALPTDHPRPAAQTFRGATHSFTLSSPLSEALQALSRREGVTLFMTLVAAFQVLLGRYSRQDDLAIGCTIANRNRPHVQELIGFFVNLLVLRTDLSGNPTFRELLRRVQEVCLGAYAHQDAPFEKLVEELQPARDLRHTPLFQVVFTFHRDLLEIAEETGWRVEPFEVDSGTAKYDVTLFLWEGKSGLRGAIEYNLDLFEPATVRRMLDHFHTLLEGVVARPDERLSDLPLLTAAERDDALGLGRAPGVAYLQGRCLHERFETQVERGPDAVALVFQNERMTYRELNQRANQLAHALRALGVRPETRVGLCLDRSPEMVIGILGVLKAGGAYVPLEPTYPAGRLRFMLEDSQVAVLVTTRPLASRLPDVAATLLCLDAEPLSGHSEANPAGGASPESLAYVIYTSGSTGQPKGALISHANVGRLFGATESWFQFGPSDVWTLFHSYAFDFSVWEMWGALLYGGRLVIVPYWVSRSPERFRELLCAERVTVLNQTPSAFYQLMEVAEAPDSSAELALRLVIFGGEALELHRLEPWFDRHGDQCPRLVNMYGITETTVHVTYRPLAAGEEIDGGGSRIGRPIPDLRLWVLDEHLHPLPVGVAGELCVGGAGLARGYLHRPDLTAERFIPDPFSRSEGARLYRSGDLARRRSDGDIEYVGRIDHQVKVRGFRIELGEIESVLAQCKAVRQSVVLAREEEPGGKRLVAYVVPDPDHDVGAAVESRASFDAEHVAQWQVLYDETYTQPVPPADPTFNIVGWNSSYTGEPIPAEEMRAWLDHTVERIRAREPRQILEIGCGTGLLLFRLAPRCTEYWGTDFSPRALEYLREQLGRPERDLPHVRLLERRADLFEGIPEKAFDAVILNSVVQYFPGVEYLLRVLEGAVERIAPGGFLFVGDVRNLALLPAFHASVQLGQASPTLSRARLRRRVDQERAQETELVLDPDFFHALTHHLPRIGNVEIQLKRGRDSNELTRFRYDVLCVVDPPPSAARAPERLDWARDGLTLSALRRYLAEDTPEALRIIAAVPNARVLPNVQTRGWLEGAGGAETVEEWRQVLRTLPPGVDPEDLWSLGEELGYDVVISWSTEGAAECCDASFSRRPATGTDPASGPRWDDPGEPVRVKPWRDYANDPLQPRLARGLVPHVRSFLQERLPDYMVPAAFVTLASLPLTAHGKVDRRALPAPDDVRPDLDVVFVAPRTPVEDELARIWSEVLGVERIGAHDDFFALGGHSLLATQLVSRLRRTFEIELPLRKLFETPTIAGLAQTIRRTRQGLAAPVIEPVERDAPLPLSFAQERLWFLDQLVPGHAFYTIPVALRLMGALDQPALHRCFQEVVRRHEALRTTFVSVGGRPVQVIAPALALTLPVVDLGGVPAPEREVLLQQRVQAAMAQPFDLVEGPLLRVLLFRLHDREHVLLVTLHHIVSDGWSMGVLVEEVAALYGAFTAGQPSPLGELGIQYADFAQWQRAWFRGEVLERQLAYWRTQLADVPPLELPTDRPRPPVQTYRGATEPLSLPRSLTESLHRLSRREDATLFMTLLAAFQTLLSRYSGQDDIVIGAGIANRNRAEVEGLIGFFVNMLALRADLSGDPSFRELLGRVREVCLGAYAHQDLPFEKLVLELSPGRDLAREPLFQVALVLQDAPHAKLELRGELAATVLEVGNRTAKYDLTVFLWESAHGLHGFIEYATDLFGAATIRRMRDHLQTLLQGAVAHPERRLSQLPLLTGAERRQLLIGWNDTGAEYEPITCVQELFETQAERAPEAIAVALEGRHLTYRELNRQANRLAHRLRARGVGPDVLVGLCLERSLEMVVGMLGILKAGGAYMPLDPAYPAERLHWMLSDTHAPVVVTREGVVARLPSTGAQLVCLDDREASPDVPGEDNPRSGVLPAHLAYVIHTSGSTGRPKGVAVSHAGLFNLVRWHQTVYEVTPADRATQLASLAFDASVWETWPYLTAGSSLHLVPEEIRSDPSALWGWIAAESITLCFLPTPLAAAMLEELRPGTPALRALLTGGDKLQHGPRHDFPCPLINHYGPTEATVVTTWGGVSAEGAVAPSIGRPIANTEVYLLDRHLQPVPVGVPGELCIGGVSLARGYVNRPELTAESFIPDPVSALPGRRLYRTGDLARYRPDGSLEFLGRLDDQVKIRGFRVEIGEIETALGSHPAVEQSAVVAVDEDAGTKRLVAYVVPNPHYQGPEAASAPTPAQAEYVSRWQVLFDETYGRPHPRPDPTFDITGWNESYTGRPLSAEEMREWVDGTAERVLTLGPERVLEIGCGTGLLLWRIAPDCQQYVATDFSEAALRDLDANLKASGEAFAHVTLRHQGADDFSGIEAGTFDTIILNSVVQYFPGIDYLVRVLEKAVTALAPGGSVFVGDVRNFALLEAFHASVQLHQAPPGLGFAQYRDRVRRHRTDDKELLIHPEFFLRLRERVPRIREGIVLLKRGRHHNELTRFRYDAILHVAADRATPVAPTRLDWERERLTAPAVRGWLTEHAPDMLVLADVLNLRVHAEVAGASWLASQEPPATAGDLRRLLRDALPVGIDPEDLCAVTGELPYDVQITWPSSGSPDRFDAIFRKTGPGPSRRLRPLAMARAELSIGLKTWRSYANNPLWSEARGIPPLLGPFLRSQLPEHMVPSAFVVLDTLPLTRHGKVDRQALILLQGPPEIGTGFAAPRTPTEDLLAGIWAEVLGRERVGIHDDFFELGGHSLLATQLISRMRAALGMDVPLRQLFEEPTIARLAAGVEAARPTGPRWPSPPILPVSRDRELPLSFAQQRLWFLDQLEPESPLYNVSLAVRLIGPLDSRALQHSLEALVLRHEVLRTTFTTTHGRPVQVIAPTLPLPLPIVDLVSRPAAEREHAVVEQAREEAQRPFDLARGPLVRSRLLRLGGEDHVLLLTLHHGVSDGWSTSIVCRETARLYHALRSGTVPDLPALPIQYADFACWQRQWLSGEILETQLAYWKTRLAGAPPHVDLPADRPRPAVRSFRGARRSFELSPTLSRALRTLSRKEGATLFMTLLAAFQTLLCRYTGQEDISVGSPIAGRPRIETEGLIGFFVNTLVLRSDLSGHPSFRQLLARVREVALGAYANQDVPFEQVVEALQPRRDLGHTPLFQVMFALENLPSPDLDLGDLTLYPLVVDSGIAQFDLTLSVSEQGPSLAGRLEYSTDLFDADMMTRLLAHWERLLSGIVADPDQRITTLPLLTDAELHGALAEWSNTAPHGGNAVCLHERFEAHAATTPDAVAVVFEGEPLTYGELNRRANQLAHGLRALGVQAETRVGLFLERALEMVIGILGILKAGGAYVPLEPTSPASRLLFMLEDSQVPVLLTDRINQPRLPPLAARVLCLDADTDAFGDHGGANIASRVVPDSLAYVIYTSGSTGQPKGVLISHANVGRLFAATESCLPFGPGDVWTLFHSYAFDFSVWEMWGALLHGGRLVIVPSLVSHSPEAFHDLLRAEQVTVLNQTPSAFHQLIEVAQAPDRSPGLALRLVIFGGEALPFRTLGPWFARHGDRQPRLVNMYGITETTVHVTYRPLRAEDRADGGSFIGAPIADLRVRVLDRNLEPLPVGIPGELYVGGAGLARGYLNRPDLTAERFVPDPFSRTPGARLYRSGDLARRRADGDLEYLGRIDQQVKIRGFRIEPGEIESALAQCPGVRQSVVLARDEISGDKRLVAYVVTEGEPGPTISELRRHLASRLPEYMLPAVFVTLDALPLTANGKVDRQALPAPSDARPELVARLVLPRTPVEEQLAGIWSELLGIETLGVHDDFFELGGHSLLATQLMSRVREALLVDLPLRALFERPTIAGLAEVVRQGRRGRTAPPIEPVPRAGAIPLSFGQERLWVLDQLLPGQAVYNVPAVLRVAGAVSERALGRSFDEVLRRHEVLRTTFSVVEDGPVQVIAPALSLPIAMVDLSGLPEPLREAELSRLIAEETARPFDLAHGPLVRVSLLRLCDAESVLVLILHHIVADAWSMGILVRELTACYEAFSHGREPVLPELPVQYADFAHWQREWLRSGVLEAELAYWRRQLADLPVLELSTDRPRPAVQTYRGSQEWFRLSPSLSGSLHALSRRSGVTLFMTLLAGLQTLLSRYTGQDTIVVGTPIANRGQVEIEGLIGFFLNTVVLRGDLAGNPTFQDLLERTREMCLGAYAHSELPFEKLVDALQPERDLSRTPLFQVMFVLQNAPPAARERPGGSSLTPLPVDSRTAKFDLTLFLWEEAEGLRGMLEYNSDLFEGSTIGRLAEHFRVLLEGAVAAPHRPLSELPLLTEGERPWLLDVCNATGATYPSGSCLHELFEAQCERTPQSVAVVIGEERLSYRVLNRRANRLAHYLRRLGVGPESRVGICLERSLDLVVGLLGILKAGGAYVPLDPDYPEQRLAFVLEDAEMSALLTRERLLEHLPRQDTPWVRLDTDAERIARESTENPPCQSGPDNLAYVLYTSGSTGKPKGVAITHRAICNQMAWMLGRFPLDESDRVLQRTPISFDASVWEFYAPLLAGAQVILAQPGLHGDAEYLSQAIAEYGVSVVQVVPSLLHVWLDTERLASCRSLRRVFAGGEALSPRALDRVFAQLSVELCNLYGPTEATINSVFWVCDGAHDDRIVPIGRPVSNTQAYVLGRELSPVPVGVPGELGIGGVGLARCYLGRPELTAERFVPDPFSSKPGARLYLTGDRCRRRADGALEFLGRLDHQVKIRGHRVEPGEVEAALREHPALDEALVVPEKTAEGWRLLAYVVEVADAVPTPRQLREYLRGRLPDYMLPALFLPLKRLPLLPNGKVDRRRLPLPQEGRPELGERFVAPGPGVEAELARVWSEVLRIDRVGVHDNFFELGGDSILGIQVVARLRGAGLHLSPHQLFQFPTIAQLGTVVSASPSVRVEQGLVTGPVPLTPIQHWFFAQDLPEPQHFNQAVLLEVREALDGGRVRRAVGHLAVHHDALRLRYRAEDGQWRQDGVGLGEESTGFEEVDLRGVEEGERAGAVQQVVARVQAGLDLGSGPLLRVVLFATGGRSDRLLMVAHHLVVDGVSWRILLEDLLTGYEQLSHGQRLELPLKTTGYKQWAERLSVHARTEALAEEVGYWREVVRGPVVALPVDHPGGANTVGSAATVEVALTVAETQVLVQEVPAAYRTQMNDVLLAALGQAVRGWTGRGAVLVDVEGHGREAVFEGVDLSRTVGWFTSLFPVRLEVDGGAGPGAVLCSVKEQLRGVPGRGLGYGVLRYLHSDDEVRRALGAARAEVSFNYLGQLDQALPESAPLALTIESTGPAQSPAGLRSHAVQVNAAIIKNRLALSFTYSPGRHERSTIERVAEGFMAALRALVAHCLSVPPGAFTASDFPLIELDRPALDRLARAHREIEDVYPLSASQAGLLYHSLMAPRSGVYFEQASCTFLGTMNVSAFQRAWQRVVARHGTLRTGFEWEGFPEAVQVVHRQASLGWEQQDWRSLSAGEQQRRQASLLEADRRQGFELDKPPLMRVALFHVKDDAWLFVWSHHHLILDGWSLPLLLKEVMLSYEGYVRGREVPLESPRPYRDFIAWLQRQDPAPAEAFWRRTLAGFTAPTPLTMGRLPVSLDESPEDEPGFQRLDLSAESTSALERLARGQHLTVNTLVQGAWALLLSRYSGEDDVLFGTTVSGRSLPLAGIESMLGLFINTLPVRVRVRPGDSVVSWLQELQAQLVELRQYEWSPLVKVQSWSEAPRGQPLFESLLVFENYPVDHSLRRPQGSLIARDIRVQERVNYPLAALVVPGPELSLRISYDGRRFAPVAIGRFLCHFRILLEGMAASPDRPLSTLPLLTDAERRQLLHDWNATRAEYPSERCAHQLFEAQATRAPDAVAVRFRDEQLSYDDLNRRANQLAHRLRAMGVGPDVLVGILAERSAELMVGILGILKAGGAYVPLDATYPRERLAFMIDDAKLPLVVTQRRLVGSLPTRNVGVVLLEADAETTAGGWQDNPVCSTLPQHLAYVIYTSGSTGQPKGTAIAHRGLCNLARATKRAFDLGQGSRVLQFASLSYDASVWEIFMALANGATLCLASREDMTPGPDLLRLLREERITIVTLPPSSLAVCRSEELPSLRTIVAGGETCSADLVARWSAGRDFFNAYGPTETTVCATMWRGEGAHEGDPPIGGPIPNLQVHVLDRQMQPLPVGVPGELHVAGVGLARGYVNRPELTAERFLPNPFGDEPGARLYRTGDLARWLPDGVLEFLGRADQQVKIHGFRVELEEVEAALREHPAVEQAVVVVREEEPGDRRLVAYVVTGDQSPTTSELRGFLGTSLPDYMLPSAFVGLPALPVTASGKVDRRALPAPERSRPNVEERFVAPGPGVEAELARVWSEVLRIDRVGVHDNFFELGGDSILGIQVVARLRGAGLHLSPHQLFQFPTIAQLGTVVSASPSVRVEQGLVTGPVPLTPIQHWFFAQDLPEPQHFNQAVLLEVREALDGGRVRRAVGHLAVHHDALRLRYRAEDGQWRQDGVGLGEESTGFEEVDLRGVEEGERAGAVQQVVARVQAGLDLGSGPLLRVVLFATGGRSDRLLMVAHHLVVDGVSWRILLEDLLTGYEQLGHGQRLELPLKTTGYKQWAERLSVHARTEALAEEVGYWREVVRGPVVALPVDHPGGANTVGSAATVEVALTVAETQALVQEVPAAYRTQMNDVLLAALGQAVRGWTGRGAVLVDVEGHGREAVFEGVDLSRTVGWFTSLFPVRLEVDGGAGPGAVLCSVKEQLRGVPGRGLGYGVLRYLHSDDEVRRALGAARAEVSFNYLGQLDQALPESAPLALTIESTGPAQSPAGERSHVLSVSGGVVGGQLWVWWTYSRQLHERSTVEWLASQFLGALRASIAHCLSPGAGGCTPSDFPLVRLDQPTVDRLVGSDRGIEDIYPLSSLQSGLLFHTLYAPESGAYFEQVSCTVQGDLDVVAFRHAWQALVDRHAILRTGFVWEGLGEPVQIVHRQVSLPWEEQDWRGLPSIRQEDSFASFSKEDRSRGFALDKAPLMRVALLRVTDDAWRLLWSHHHLLLDGWSLPLLLKEVLASYEAHRQGRSAPLERPRPYRDFIAWVQRQDRTAAEAYWRETLKGFTAPTPLVIERSSRRGPDEPAATHAEQRQSISREASMALELLARRQQLTLNTIVQGAWALLLSRYSGEEDIVFGTTVSGRSAPLAGIETMLGLFINTLPVRVRVPADEDVVSWLRMLQERLVELRRFEWSPLAQVQGWSEVPRGVPLFESLVVFENYPVDRVLLQRGGRLNVHDVRTEERTNYPLAVVAVPGVELSLRILYDERRFARVAITRLLGHLTTLLEALAAGPGGSA